MVEACGYNMWWMSWLEEENGTYGASVFSFLVFLKLLYIYIYIYA